MMDLFSTLLHRHKIEPYHLWLRQRRDLILDGNKCSMWKQILPEGKAEKIKDFLAGFSSEAECYQVVNGIFEQDQEVSQWSSHENKKFAVITPLAMVMSCASISGMECLLQHGANVSSQDPYGHNPVHLIICFSFIKPQLNHIWVAMFESLVAWLPFNTVKQMFLTENRQGLKPVEFAVYHGSPHIVCVYGVYLLFAYIVLNQWLEDSAKSMT